MAKLCMILFVALVAGVAAANSAAIETRRLVIFDWRGNKYILDNERECPKDKEGQWVTKDGRSCRCFKVRGLFGIVRFSFRQCKRVPCTTTTTPSPVGPTTGAPVAPVDPTTQAPVAPVDPTTEAPVAPVDPTTEAPVVAPVDPTTEAAAVP